MVASPWEHLQSVLMRTQNPIVREEFRDIVDDDDISIPRGSLKVACLLQDNDSATQTMLRLMLFYIILRKAQDLQVPIYGIPVPSFQEARKFRPQIQLYFQEDFNDVEPGYSPVTGEISFRLMNENGETLNETEARQYANRVRTAFAAGAGFVWRKGKLMCSYTDRARGYQLQLLCRDKAEGKRVIEQVLDIQNHAPDWKYLNVSENDQPTARFPTLPPTDFIYGKNRRLPRQRPIADVRFQYAVLHIHGVNPPIVLVDRSGIFRNPLATVA
ncbi:hypothetical protein HJG54_35285 (plasmid) [Leptolyngbya sp. NK1-12]|uniref:Uncharacterized protein n=1 Tax=Leptolyngbya sp. NK1-12 TaxID=2547451 RepID=A0AA96WMX1_9CYAN|nr:hypothetical protein [Leptolyngbya sp. NK1-12]WNZ28179.1 hypothetical protein HJG54_35285 [Leptolyngbya sp. NK1-12]